MGKKITLDYISRKIKETGGKCISEKYVNPHEKMQWECKYGHKWKTKWNHIQQGSWCPYCAKNVKLSISDLKELAKQQGGLCLSKKYINNRTPLKWQCKLGHEWWARPDNIKQGGWCPICNRGEKLTIESLKKLANQYGGECLSSELLGFQGLLKWQCIHGHKWKASPSNIKYRKSWCPQCASGKGERICRVIFESIFQEPFPKIRPSWLKSNKGVKLELDGFCSKLKIAFEYQGNQHFALNPLFHNSEKDLDTQKIKDDLKKSICRENEIILIEVPQFEMNADFEEIRVSILHDLLSEGFNVEDYHWDQKLDFTDVYIENQLMEAQDFAAQHGGKCLSEGFLSDHREMQWQCKKGHKWKQSFSKLRAKKTEWCPDCAKETPGHSRVVYTIQHMQKLAEAKKGKCLSSKYVNGKTPLRWRCKFKHTWVTIPNSIKRGSWCPICAKFEGAKKRSGKNHWTKRTH